MSEGYPESVQAAMADDGSHVMTPPLEDYIKASNYDDNTFWRLDAGHHLNLLDEAIDLLETAQAQLLEAQAALGDAWDDGWEAAMSHVMTKSDNPHPHR